MSAPQHMDIQGSGTQEPVPGVQVEDAEVQGNGRNLKDLPGASFLMLPDSILSPNVEKHLRSFLDAGGTETEAFSLMAESYEGVPDMIRTVTSWSTIVSPPTRDTTAKDGVTKLLQRALEEVVEEHEAQMVQKVDQTMYVAERPPTFMHNLLESKRWAPVMERIAKRHKGSALFNFLLRSSRLKKAGISHEVVSEPARFLNALHDAVSRLLTKSTITAADLATYYKQVRTLAAYDEACAAIAGRLFAHLARDAADPFTRALYRRTAQEIRAEAVRAMKAVAGVEHHTALKFAQRLAIVLESVAARRPVDKKLVDAIVSSLSETLQRGFDADTQVINQHYRGLLGEAVQANGNVPMEIEINQEEAERREVLIGVLCHSEVFQALIHSLFTVKGRCYSPGGVDFNKNRRDAHCLLLSYAATMAKLSPSDIISKLQNKDEFTKLRERAAKLRQDIGNVVKICEELVPGCPRYKFKGKPVKVLIDALEEPVVASGLIEWAREGLYGAEDQRTLLVTAPKHLAFVEGIAEKHPALREYALDILHDGFGRVYKDQMSVLDAEKLRDMFLQSMVNMVPLFMGPQIVNMFVKYYATDHKVDGTHLRNFVRGLLDIISPPYDPAFAQSVATLLNSTRVKEACDREMHTRNLVLAFWKDYGELKSKVSIFDEKDGDLRVKMERSEDMEVNENVQNANTLPIVIPDTPQA